MNIRSFDPFLAHPTSTTALENVSVVLASQVSQECKDIDHCRTLQSIIYTCFSTIFLCTWVVLHLNVPRHPKNTTPHRHVWFMLGALIAPEAIFIVAFNDWLRGSVMLERLLGTLYWNGCQFLALMQPRTFPRLWLDRGAHPIRTNGRIPTYPQRRYIKLAAW